jgi:hypothetical protein
MAGDVRRFGGVGDACDEVLCCAAGSSMSAGVVECSAARHGFGRRE